LRCNPVSNRLPAPADFIFHCGRFGSPPTAKGHFSCRTQGTAPCPLRKVEVSSPTPCGAICFRSSARGRPGWPSKSRSEEDLNPSACAPLPLQTAARRPAGLRSVHEIPDFVALLRQRRHLRARPLDLRLPALSFRPSCGLRS